MEILWCRRCKDYMPMLDDEEYQVVQRLFNGAMWDAKATSLPARFKPLIDYYHELTGMRDENPNSIAHHRISLYGPPCESCGKPYRTPMAKFCAACGHKRPL